MFRQRTSSQKPGDALLADFRQQFPQLGSSATDAQPQTATASDDPVVNAPPGEDRLQSIDGSALRDQDPTPRASHEPSWRLTPSLLDPNSFSFASFANAPPGYYTPTPGGGNTLFHPQAGDLHSPALALGHGLGTPLSMPTSADAAQAGAIIGQIDGFQELPPHQFHHFNPFVQSAHTQQTFAPSSFVHRDTGYETMEQDGSPMGSDPPESRMKSLESTMHTTPPMMTYPPQQQLSAMQRLHQLPPSADRFRYHTALNAPTAMVKHADEIPITYLNKGQAYSLSIMDLNAAGPAPPGTRYRTFVRVSFEDEEQRQKPAVCWGLWKEGRGTNEAHQRGGKLQAVEYVESTQPSDMDDRKTRVELEWSSFDGFSVLWTPGSGANPEVNLAVRFNFLSTDFSHSKGVKGIPVRLCSKTHTIPADGAAQDATTYDAEICYCKVKLFRDHGAERKLSNDVAHVKKSIDKIKQSISQAESGMKDFSKRRKSAAVSRVEQKKPGKAPKHKRTWSMSSASSAGAGGRTTIEEDLHFKLQTLQDMFTSTRPISILYLKGEDPDDPDLHPVTMPGDMSPPSRPDTTRDASAWQPHDSRDSITTASLVSPSPSALSLPSQSSVVNRGGAPQWQRGESGVTQVPQEHRRISKPNDDGSLGGYIEVTEVDPTYKPPAEPKTKPVACFYMLRADQRDPSHGKNYHRAIYLFERSLRELNEKVTAKWGISGQVLKTVHVLQDGLEVEVDDDVVRELKEGQDMSVEFDTIKTPVKREWDMAVDHEEPADVLTDGVMLRLKF